MRGRTGTIGAVNKFQLIWKEIDKEQEVNEWRPDMGENWFQGSEADPSTLSAPLTPFVVSSCEVNKIMVQAIKSTPPLHWLVINKSVRAGE